MHEHSLMRNLLNQVKAMACEQGCAEVASIQVESGTMSGVDSRLLARAYEQLAKDQIFERGEFSIEEVPLEAECKSCSHAFEVRDFRFSCPLCGANVRVVRGDQCQLVSVSFFQQDLA